VLVRGIVVENRMDHLAGRHRALDGIEELDEILMPVVRHAAADDLALEHVEGDKQRCRAVALVVAGHRAALAGLQRQAGLGAVEPPGVTRGLDPLFSSIESTIWRAPAGPCTGRRCAR
jgi:hypothetical protein